MLGKKGLRIALGVLIALLLVVIVLRWMFWSPPRWYDPPDASDPAAETLADQVEQRLAEESHRIRESDALWTLRIRDHQVNAWLAIKAPAWLRRETGESWPHQLATPQVRFRPEAIQLVLPIQDESRARYIVAVIRPQLTSGSDRLQASITRLNHGRLRLPGSPDQMLNTLIDRHLPDAANDNDELLAIIFDVLRGGSIEHPGITLQDGRVIELQHIALGRGTLDITARTIAADQDRR